MCENEDSCAFLFDTSLLSYVKNGEDESFLGMGPEAYSSDTHPEIRRLRQIHYWEFCPRDLLKGPKPHKHQLDIEIRTSRDFQSGSEGFYVLVSVPGGVRGKPV